MCRVVGHIYIYNFLDHHQFRNQEVDQYTLTIMYFHLTGGRNILLGRLVVGVIIYKHIYKMITTLLNYQYTRLNQNMAMTDDNDRIHVNATKENDCFMKELTLKVSSE